MDSSTAQNVWDQHLRGEKVELMKVDSMGAFIRTFAPLQSMLHRHSKRHADPDLQHPVKAPLVAEMKG